MLRTVVMFEGAIIGTFGVDELSVRRAKKWAAQQAANEGIPLDWLDIVEMPAAQIPDLNPEDVLPLVV